MLISAINLLLHIPLSSRSSFFHAVDMTAYRSIVLLWTTRLFIWTIWRLMCHGFFSDYKRRSYDANGVYMVYPHKAGMNFMRRTGRRWGLFLLLCMTGLYWRTPSIFLLQQDSLWLCWLWFLDTYLSTLETEQFDVKRCMLSGEFS